MRGNKLALYGILLMCVGATMYVAGVFIALPRRLLVPDSVTLAHLNSALVWYSGLPIIAGFAMLLLDLFMLYPVKRSNDFIKDDTVSMDKVTVTLTAYNDELSIGAAVQDFLSHPRVARVIVISNNSRDRTLEVAQAAGALAFNETLQGYGACVHRALSEAMAFEDTEVTVLCEGDMTFRASDIDKFLAYIRHADIVTGTRTVEQLRAKETQLSTFMFYGNLFVGKLLEVKHLGNVTLTDVGTTYKACRTAALRGLMPQLDPKVNLEFNPYFLDVALDNGLRVVEIPITFHKRIGDSKGGNVNNWIAAKLGFRMMRGILWNWPATPARRTS